MKPFSGKHFIAERTNFDSIFADLDSFMLYWFDSIDVCNAHSTQWHAHKTHAESDYLARRHLVVQLLRLASKHSKYERKMCIFAV